MNLISRGTKSSDVHDVETTINTNTKLFLQPVIDLKTQTLPSQRIPKIRLCETPSHSGLSVWRLNIASQTYVNSKTGTIARMSEEIFEILRQLFTTVVDS